MGSGSPLVPAGPARAETEVKKSRFIAHADNATTRAAALAVVGRVRREFPDARHCCWAYLTGDPERTASAAADDDGEPSGTAGQPILGVIRHKGIGDVVVVVVRYFGGVKLGAGGLTRAYAGATETVMAGLPLVRHHPRSRVRLAMGFADEQALRHWAGHHAATLEVVDYGDGVGMVLMVADADLEALQSFCAARGVTHSAIGPVTG